jgi:hypothetical protein
VAQADGATARQPLVAGRGVEAEVVAVDDDLPPERKHALAGPAHVRREVRAGQLLDLALGPRGDRHPERPQHPEHPGRHPVEVVAHAELELADVDHGVDLGHADEVGEGPDGLGAVAPPAHAGDGGHAGVVPAADVALLDEGEQLALAHDRVVHVQPGELDLLGPACMA